MNPYAKLSNDAISKVGQLYACQLIVNAFARRPIWYRFEFAYGTKPPRWERGCYVCELNIRAVPLHTEVPFQSDVEARQQGLSAFFDYIGRLGQKGKAT